MFIYSRIINFGSINSWRNTVAFKWEVVIGSLEFIIHSAFPYPTERCNVGLRTDCILIEINLYGCTKRVATGLLGVAVVFQLM